MDDNSDSNTQMDGGIQFCLKSGISRHQDNIILITKTKYGDSYMFTMRIMTIQDEENSSEEDVMSL